MDRTARQLLCAVAQVSNGLQTLVPQAAGAGLSIPDYLRIVDNYVKVSLPMQTTLHGVL